MTNRERIYFAAVIAILIWASAGCEDFNRRANCRMSARDAKSVDACLETPQCIVTPKQLRVRNWVRANCPSV